MPDATAPATAPAAATPAPTAAPAPQQQDATVTPLKPHHAHQQPRTEGGQFSGPPQQQAKPTAPQYVELDGERIPMDELRARLAERQEDARAAQAEREELARLRQEAQRWQQPYEALTREQREEITRRELEAFLQQQEEAKLPPDQRAFLQQRREFERQQAEFRRQQEAQQQRAQAAQQQQERKQAAANVSAALKALGTDERDALALRLVADEFWTAASQGKQYTPDVVARRVQRQLDSLATQRAARLGPKPFLQHPEFVAALNSLEDAELLKVLTPLGERLRSLNLQARGISAPSAPPVYQSTQQQAGATVTQLPQGREPRTDGEWAAWFQAGNQPSAPHHFQAMQRLRAAGKL